VGLDVASKNLAYSCGGICFLLVNCVYLGEKVGIDGKCGLFFGKIWVYFFLKVDVFTL